MSSNELQNDTTYAPVRHKKQEGSLTLSAQQIAFSSDNASPLIVSWSQVSKHQVSPASYPKALLKLILKDNTNKTFQLPNRPTLERLRQDVTARLLSTSKTTNKKRPFSEVSSSTTSFGALDATALAVTRSSLLAANPALRQQHAYLVQESKTVSEDDFWKTHQHLVEEEYARMSGVAKAGTSSLLQSHLPNAGRVVLGVEEMRQIFILYPAVHKAYEEKVPLELSDEQFWRKYLESEYFHRDRGRIGTAARNHAAGSGDTTKNSGLLSMEEQEARAAAVGTDDLFSRYDQKLHEENGDTPELGGRHRRPRWGQHLAVGQFDLASTFETERGELLEGPRDNHPPNQVDDKGSRVIEKYNRHWAMVLHPDEAVAGSNLMEVARRSAKEVLPDDEDAEYGGGVDEEMRRLVDYANAAEEEANHAKDVGDEPYEELTLKNVEAYYAGQLKKSNAIEESDDEAAKRHAVFANAMAAQTLSFVQSLETDKNKSGLPPSSCFPPAGLGKQLLTALTKKMAQDSMTESASLDIVNQLPEDFRKRLQFYFRRSSELMRHFYGLRRSEGGSTVQSQKLSNIVLTMESFYREMEGMRKDLPQTETGEMMRKMCLPIMDQLDWAFKLHREGTGGGGGGGFVAVDESY